MKDFWAKLEDAKIKKASNQSSKLDVEATGRMIKNILSTNSVDKFNSISDIANNNLEKDKKRKTKGAVPIPEASHLNWEKSLK